MEVEEVYDMTSSLNGKTLKVTVTLRNFSFFFLPKIIQINGLVRTISKFSREFIIKINQIRVTGRNIKKRMCARRRTKSQSTHSFIVKYDTLFRSRVGER